MSNLLKLPTIIGVEEHPLLPLTYSSLLTRSRKQSFPTSFPFIFYVYEDDLLSLYIKTFCRCDANLNNLTLYLSAPVIEEKILIADSKENERLTKYFQSHHRIRHRLLGLNYFCSVVSTHGKSKSINNMSIDSIRNHAIDSICNYIKYYHRLYYTFYISRDIMLATQFINSLNAD